MIVVQFSFNVPEEKIQEFLEYSNSILKKLGNLWDANLTQLTEAQLKEFVMTKL